MQQCLFCERPVDGFKEDFHDVIHYECPVCKNVLITREALMNYPGHFQNIGYLISGYIREYQFYEKKPLLLKTSTFQQILDSPNIPREVMEKANKLILWIGYSSNYPGKNIRIETYNDYPICYGINSDEIDGIISFLCKSEVTYEPLDEDPRYRGIILTEIGWERFSNLKYKTPNNKNFFVAMWFEESMNDFYKNAIAKAISDAGYFPVRVDYVEHNGKICDRIIREIKNSRCLVADFTGHRAGVYFETGYAMGLGLPVIWLCKKDDLANAHFDTRQYNHIAYETEIELYKRLYDRILVTII